MILYQVINVSFNLHLKELIEVINFNSEGS